MTDTLFPLDEVRDPFALTDNGVPVDLLEGAEARDTSSSFLRIAADVLDDDAVGDLVADVGAAGLGLWLALLVDAKNARAFGVVTFNAMPFGGRFGASPVEVIAALRAMERAGLIDLRLDGRRCTVRVRRWHRWQAMTDRERSALAKARSDAGVRARKTREPDTGFRERDTGFREPATTGLTTPETGDGIPEERTLPSPPARASAPVREAGSFEERLAPHLADLYPDAEQARRVASEVVFHGFQRKAKFRFGMTVDALAFGVRSLEQHLADRPEWTPADPVQYIVKRAQSFNPDAADLTPTRKARPDDAPRFLSDESLARFR